MTDDTVYHLAWEGGGVFEVSGDRAAEITREWRRHGVVTGGLIDGHVSYLSDFGKRASLRLRPKLAVMITHDAALDSATTPESAAPMTSRS